MTGINFLGVTVGTKVVILNMAHVVSFGPYENGGTSFRMSTGPNIHATESQSQVLEYLRGPGKDGGEHAE